MEMEENLTLYDSTTLFDESFNISLEQYLLLRIGPKQLPLNIIVPLTIVYLIIFVTGVVGNFVVCVVIVRHSTMHTATNYYLFSLAISDLTLLLLGLPNDLSVFWHQYPYQLGIGFCKLRALVSETASYVSVLTIVAFSMERYLAICHPLHLYTMSGLQRAIRIIAILWIVSLISAIPFALYTKINYLEYPPNSGQMALESAFCAMLEQPPKWPIWELSSILFFLVPMFVILILYVRMGLKIRSHTKGSLGKGVNGSVHGESRHSQNRKAIIRMLAAVVIAFFVCWAPFHAQRLLYIYFQDSPHFNAINEWMFYITGILYYVSSTVNPILYNVMSNRYRVAFKETLCGGRRKNGAGLVRDQSSFRDTMVGCSTYEGTQLIRVKSIVSDRMHNSINQRYLKRYNSSIKRHNEVERNRADGNIRMQMNENKNIIEEDENQQKEDENKEVTTSDVVVRLPPTVNGKTTCFTAANLNHTQNETDSLDETCKNDTKSNINLVESCI